MNKLENSINHDLISTEKCVIAQNISVVQDCINLIALNQFQYSLIGSHIRHIIEHYEIFLSAFENQTVIHYENRGRNIKQETIKHFALHSLEKIINQLSDISLFMLGNSAIVSEQKNMNINTCYLRELVFLNSHTIHHQAIIKFILFKYNIKVPSHFGIAPSTLVHKNN